MNNFALASIVILISIITLSFGFSQSHADIIEHHPLISEQFYHLSSFKTSDNLKITTIDYEPYQNITIVLSEKHTGGVITVELPSELLQSRYKCLPSSGVEQPLVLADGIEIDVIGTLNENIFLLEIQLKHETSQIEIITTSDMGLWEFPNGCLLEFFNDAIPFYPNKQIQKGILAENIICKPGLELTLKNISKDPACVKPETKVRLMERGWIELSSSTSTTNGIQFTNNIECMTDYSNLNDEKFDSGLLDKIYALLDADKIREYSVLLWVADANKEKVETVLKHCHDVSNIYKAKKLSFVSANVSLYEIPKLADYDIIGKIGAGELFELPANLEQIEGKTWVEVDPIQCLGNPWEVNWLVNNNDDYSEYYSLDEEETSQVIKNYYKKDNIVIFDVKTAITHDLVCLSCGCPQGYTLYLLVLDDTVKQMLELGYILSDV